MKNKDSKILWGFNIRTDHVIEARGSDVVLIYKKYQETFIIDTAIPGDFRVRDKDLEKTLKYQDLALEISRMWNTKTRVILI